MDKKKLAQTLGLAGGILILLMIVLWFIPTLKYDAGMMSPLKYFVLGAQKSNGLYDFMKAANADYNTNQDMYWIAFGTLFAVANTIVTFTAGKKLAPKMVGCIFALFLLVGCIISGVLHLSVIWVVYLIVAILAVACYACAWWFQYND